MSADDRRGMTLLEVLVAVVVLATGIAALQRLVGRSVATVATDAALTRAMLAAQALLAEAAVAPPPLGRTAGRLTAHGPALRFAREVRPTPHPGLREVRVRVFPAGGDHTACELVELVRVPAP